MSRGRGRGRGAGFGRNSVLDTLMGDISFDEFRKFSTRDQAMFPDVELPGTLPPSTRESKYHTYATFYQQQLRQGPYYLEGPKAGGPVEHYADRFLGSSSAAAKSNKDLAIAKLQDPQQMTRLNKDFFPINVWEPFYEKKTAKKQRDKRKRVDIDGLIQDAGPDGAEDGERNSDSEQDVELQESEDSEEDGDYDNNYFEDGEDDEGGEAGGDGEDGGVMD